ncbi:MULTISPECIES: hypothetical protein [unclassified Corynebacterium]|uniref:hypothetical protein n=1 Tax=unclassified Corynebacterium TaxID=2624378 RepID=UPI001EF4FE78|nr:MULTISPECIES: hypothetical protein [unclassified Corynebacterium]MCG7289248.1 hypothetical protein [Corynebacterium sp. ACRPZ]MCG7293536.1 hypothetical protein [Corynebacterium sp. ACRPY]
MGRLLLLALVVLAVALLWRAFGPGSAERYGSPRGGSQPGQKPEIKGPDDDEEFLWNIEKNRFKERRAREEAERKRREEEERRRRRGDS